MFGISLWIIILVGILSFFGLCAILLGDDDDSPGLNPVIMASMMLNNHQSDNTSIDVNAGSNSDSGGCQMKNSIRISLTKKILKFLLEKIFFPVATFGFSYASLLYIINNLPSFLSIVLLVFLIILILTSTIVSFIEWNSKQ